MKMAILDETSKVKHSATTVEASVEILAEVPRAWSNKHNWRWQEGIVVLAASLVTPIELPNWSIYRQNAQFWTIRLSHHICFLCTVVSSGVMVIEHNTTAWYQKKMWRARAGTERDGVHCVQARMRPFRFKRRPNLASPDFPRRTKYPVIYGAGPSPLCLSRTLPKSNGYYFAKQQD